MSCEGSKLLQTYLMASYTYYHLNRIFLRDDQYDRVCKRLLEIFDTFEHQHKYLVSKADLEAGTAYSIREYPTMVRMAASIALDKREILG